MSLKSTTPVIENLTEGSLSMTFTSSFNSEEDGVMHCSLELLIIILSSL